MGHRNYQRALSLTPVVAVLALTGAVVLPAVTQPVAHAQTEIRAAQAVSTLDLAPLDAATGRDPAGRSQSVAETSRSANRAALLASIDATQADQTSEAARVQAISKAKAQEQVRLQDVKAAALLVQQRQARIRGQMDRLHGIQTALRLLHRNKVQALAAQRAASQAAKRAASKAAQRATAQRQAVQSTLYTTRSGSPKAFAQSLIGTGTQYGCLDRLWTRESGWNYLATNPSSGAYGIPQSLPASKMASAGADWRTNSDTQIRWGLGYISGRYGTPCAAWAHSQAVGWY
jgi:hypothetical protein